MFNKIDRRRLENRSRQTIGRIFGCAEDALLKRAHVALLFEHDNCFFVFILKYKLKLFHLFDENKTPKILKRSKTSLFFEKRSL